MHILLQEKTTPCEPQEKQLPTLANHVGNGQELDINRKNNNNLNI